MASRSALALVLIPAFALAAGAQGAPGAAGAPHSSDASSPAPETHAEDAKAQAKSPKGRVPEPAKGDEGHVPEPAKGDASKKAAAKEENPQIPPSLSLHALCEELSQSALERDQQLKKLANEREALKKEREELEKLAKEVAGAREQLKADTDRLVAFAELAQDAVKPGGDKYWSTRVAQVNANGGKDFDGLAKTLKSMRADQAAALLARVDRALAAAVLQRLRPAESSPILDKLKPEVAAELFGIMATDGAREARK